MVARGRQGRAAGTPPGRRAVTEPGRIDLADLVRQGRRLAGAARPAAERGRLGSVEDFGPNPGALRLRCFVPEGLAPGAPLLVALHGCAQDAAGFDRGCGWSTLAKERGFTLLLPEQTPANNPNRCFHWFEPAHTAREGGAEAQSILAMVRHMRAAHRLDPARIHVTGLSAGGAMAVALFAAHPEVFAAGAVIAGLPYGAASGLKQALTAMAAPQPRAAEAWADAVRAAAPGHAGAWPRLAIWHGEADSLVHPAHGEALAQQWAALHGLAGARPRRAAADGPGGITSRAWHGPDGRVLVEHHSLQDFPHGVPIRPGRGPGRCGEAMPFLLESRHSAPHRITDFLGLGACGATAAAPLPGVVTVARDGTAWLGPAPARDGAEPVAAEAPRRASQPVGQHRP